MTCSNSSTEEPQRGDEQKKAELNQEQHKKDDDEQVVPLLQLFRYSTRFDKFLIGTGCLLASLTGTAIPLLVLLFGELIDVFVEFEIVKQTLAARNEPIVSSLNYSASIASEPKDLSYIFDKAYLYGYILLAAAVLNTLFAYLFVCCLSKAAARQAYRIKVLFYESLLRQEVSWFDDQASGDFASRITTDLKKIEDAIGEKIGIFLNAIFTSFVSLVIAFAYDWKFTLVLIASVPLITLASGLVAKVQASGARKEVEAYAAAGSIAQEVISMIKTVFAFGGESKELARYEASLLPAKKSGIRRNVATGLALAFMWFCMYTVYFFGIWYGTKLIIDARISGDNSFSGGVLTIVMWNVMCLGFFFGQATPYIECFQMAKGAAWTVFSIIERKPQIDALGKEGDKLKNFSPSVKFEDVFFSYPSRPDVDVLKGVSLEIGEGETVAVVGPSGSGKSTLVQLIQRFYDCAGGKVLVGGFDVKGLNVGWLRSQVGVVGQEPVLFDTTIKENIALGINDGKPEMSEIVQAAVNANADEFIASLPDKYDTMTGDRGTQLSGGQKQRIAIARALVRRPRILLLDEATSALDRESESIVQAALDKARIGRTTLIVAHRLSTVQSADKIVVLDKGVVTEKGKHHELLEKRGLYYSLFQAQESTQVTVGAEDVDIDDETEEKPNNADVAANGTCNPSKPRLDSVREAEFKIENCSDADGDTSYYSHKDLFQFLRKDLFFILLGCVSAVVAGLIVPIYSILFGDYTVLYSEPDNEKVYNESWFYAWAFVVIAVVAALASMGMIISFGLVSERLTMRLRKSAFASILSQDVSWFDKVENGCGTLCARLSSDAANVQGLSGSRMSTICQSVSTLSACMILSLYLNWKFGLMLIAFVPFLLYSAILYARMNQGNIAEDTDNIATQAVVSMVSSIKTVTSLHQQSYFYNLFESALREQLCHKSRQAHYRGFILGYIRSVTLFAYSGAFFYGTYLVSRNQLHYSTFFKISESIIYGCGCVSDGAIFAADYEKAKRAASNLLKLIQSKRWLSNTSSGCVPSKCEGNVEFKRIGFRYPSRPEATVLNGLSLNISKGETVALVGASGCGKSTTFQLLQKFYSPAFGQITFDGAPIDGLNTSWLRSRIGLVSQEPLLFGCSIRENIAYGDNTREVPFPEIIEAARKANIHDFVKSLPGGYDTQVGEKGGLLSGGQKQRIAIARALLRNPAILLLDEATAALDTESEKVVQDALDEARQGRTCLMIAHRLSTVRNADKIAVIRKGKLVELGTHDELLAATGHYHQLYHSQV